MGVDYDVVAGYGVKIPDEYLGEDKYESAEQMAILLTEGTLGTAGDYYCGDVDYYLLLSNPLHKDIEQFVTELQKFEFAKHIKTPKDLTWVCQLCIS